jgi:hypothetical protein
MHGINREMEGKMGEKRGFIGWRKLAFSCAVRINHHTAYQAESVLLIRGPLVSCFVLTRVYWRYTL